MNKKAFVLLGFVFANHLLAPPERSALRRRPENESLPGNAKIVTFREGGPDVQEYPIRRANPRFIQRINQLGALVQSEQTLAERTSPRTLHKFLKDNALLLEVLKTCNSKRHWETARTVCDAINILAEKNRIDLSDMAMFRHALVVIWNQWKIISQQLPNLESELARKRYDLSGYEQELATVKRENEACPKDPINMSGLESRVEDCQELILQDEHKIAVLKQELDRSLFA